MNEYIVRKSLSYRYRMKLYSDKDSSPDNMYIQHKWPEMIERNEQIEHFSYMDEYICIRCKTSLQKKNPKMPDQACGNGLKLDDIPQDLLQLLTIERRLISYRLPFINILIVQ